ncbi:hypothetical protein I7I48_05833 [Histoplasma ohiense]|nr:hypothetical protein I7I48_05833 [Histoplasma ohiense (nom. inval.)]
MPRPSILTLTSSLLPGLLRNKSHSIHPSIHPSTTPAKLSLLVAMSVLGLWCNSGAYEGAGPF